MEVEEKKESEKIPPWMQKIEEVVGKREEEKKKESEKIPPWIQKIEEVVGKK